MTAIKGMDYGRDLELFDGYSSECEFDSILAGMESETSMADVMRKLGCGCTLKCFTL